MKKWKVWEAMKEKVEQFRQTMPLIQDLKNPALRPRHWDALRSEVSRLRLARRKHRRDADKELTYCIQAASLAAGRFVRFSKCKSNTKKHALLG